MIRESYDEVYNGPTRKGAIEAGKLDVEKTGKFTQEVKGRHIHKWIFGSENAVCTKCGYTIPKDAELPEKGLWDGESMKGEPSPVQTKQMGEVWAATDGKRSCIAVSESEAKQGVEEMKEAAAPTRAGMTTEEYRKAPGLNFSLAKHLLKSPAHFKAAQDEEKEETDAMRIGTLAHAMILEGKDLRDLYAIKPAGMSFATKEGKAWRDAQTLPILKEEDANMIPQAAQKITENPHAAHILKQCQHRETPIFGTIMGVQCKALLDCHGTDGVAWVINDLKTSTDASQKGFAKSVINFDLDLQAAFYCTLLANIEGLETPPFFVWTAVEKAAPFANAVYTAEQWMESGMRKLERVMDLYKECVSSGEWPMPYRGINQLERPAWA